MFNNFVSIRSSIIAASSLLGVVAFILFIPFGRPFPVNHAYAGSGDALFGDAWSETIGWISFNCTNTNEGGCGSSNYGVNVDANGNFSGYAWSENVGWISFNAADVAGCPNGSCSAVFNPSSDEVSGWARALAANSPTSAGWDGWIKLQSTSGEPAYGVAYNTGSGQFQGYAWGGDVVGWISFNCSDAGSCGQSNYFVGGNINTAPTVSDLTADPASSATYCGAPSQHLSWTFSDAQDGSTQTAYQLQVSDNANFTNIVFDSGKVTTSSTGVYVSVSSEPQTNQLSFNRTYYWRVQVYDSGGLSSGYATGPSFATPKHAYPQPAFTWSPTSPSQGEIAIFTDQTIFDPGSLSHAWQWSIPNATYVDGTSATSQNPHVRFTSQQSVTVVLTASDDVGSCSTPSSGPAAKTIVVRPPLPHFKEVQP